MVLSKLAGSIFCRDLPASRPAPKFSLDLSYKCRTSHSKAFVHFGWQTIYRVLSNGKMTTALLDRVTHHWISLRPVTRLEGQGEKLKEKLTAGVGQNSTPINTDPLKRTFFVIKNTHLRPKTSPIYPLFSHNIK